MSSSSPSDAVFDAGPFSFERGGAIDAMRVGYATWGELDPERGNAVRLLGETSGGRHSYDAHIGPGLAYDTERYFVVAVDPIGGGASS